MKIRIIFAAIIAVILIPAFCAAGNITLIGNPSVTVSTLSKQDVKYIFMGKKRAWKDQSKIVIATQEGTDAQKEFLKNYLKKSPLQYTNHWRKQIFTGRGSLPQSFASDQEIVKFISETKGAIGYVSSSANLDNVKTIEVK